MQNDSLKPVLIIIILVSILSCSETKKTTNFLIYEVSNSTPIEENMSSVIDIIEVIELNDRIGPIKDLQIHQNNFIIRTVNPPVIKLINSEGMEVCKFGSIGTGPGQHININDFTIVEDKLFLLDRSALKIYQYDIGCNLIQTFTNPMYSQAIHSSDDQLFLYNGSEISEISDHKLVSYDVNKAEVINQYFSISKASSAYLNFYDRSNFSHNEYNRFYYSFNDTVFTLASGAPEPAYYIDLGTNKMQAKDYDADYANSYEFITDMRKKERALRIIGLEENKTNIAFLFEENNFKYTIINKLTNKTTIVKALNDDLFANNRYIDGEELFSYLPIHATEEMYYMYLSEEQITNQNFIDKHRIIKGKGCIVKYKYK